MLVRSCHIAGFFSLFNGRARGYCRCLEMDDKELQFILQEGEGQFIEFREEVRHCDKDIVAFANASGGRLFLGVKDNGEVKGISVANSVLSQVQDIARNCDPSIPVQVKSWKNIIIVEIPEGNDKLYKCKEGFFIRMGPNSQKMSRDQIVELVTATGKVKFDEQVHPYFDVKKDLDRKELGLFLKANHLHTTLNQEDVLANLGLLSKGKVNNAGILFFSKNPSHFFVDAYVDCVLFKGKEKTNVIDRKMVKSGLLSQLSEGITFFKKNLRLSYHFKDEKREEEYEIPIRVLEEALVNALMHRDYSFPGANISLFIFDDRVEVISPGGLPPGLEKKSFGKLSVRRNKIIADIFSRTPYVEKLGSGIGRMNALMEKAQLPKPHFEMDHFFVVTLQRRLLEPLTEPLTEPLSEPLKKMWEFIAREKPGKSQIIAQFGFSRATATRYLARLQRIGLVQYIGARKKGHYQVRPKQDKA